MKQPEKAIIAVAVITVVALIGALLWWQYGLGRNVYAVDVPITGAPDSVEELRLAVIGDFGDASQREADVAEMVHRWQTADKSCTNFSFFNRWDVVIDSYTLTQ